jgi:hypothetical protein
MTKTKPTGERKNFIIHHESFSFWTRPLRIGRGDVWRSIGASKERERLARWKNILLAGVAE